MLMTFGPIWILTALGYAARRAGLLDEGSVLTLSRLVYHLAMPAALFLTLWRTPMSELAILPLIAFAASTLLVMGLAWIAAIRLFGRTRGESAIWGMSAGYVNSANLGLPVALQVLGDTSLLSEVVLLQVLVVTPIILIALDRHSDEEGRIKASRLVTLPFRNPVIIASALGAAASAAHLRLPGIAQTSLTLLAGAAVPLALVSLGASLHQKRDAADAAGIDGGVGVVSAVTALKLVAQPVIAYAVAAFLLPLSPQQVLAVVVCAGLPTAQNTYIFAQKHASAPLLASRTVVLTTVLSLGSLAATVALLNS